MAQTESAMCETQVLSQGWEALLEKEKATHSSTLAWRIPRTGEPGRHSLWGHEELDTTERLTHRAGNNAHLEEVNKIT